MARTSDGALDPVTQQVRGVDLRARAPHPAVPPQGGPPLAPSRPGPPPVGPRVLGPPSGPAMRSPLVTPQGRPTPQHPSGEQTPLHDAGAVPVKECVAAWWRRAVAAARTPAGRWSLIGVVAALQVFLLFSTVMWWAGGTSSVTASSKLAPMTWTGIVYDVGAAGVNLRSATTVTPESTKDTAARGSRLAVSCGQTGDVVQKGTVNTATWLKTTDGLFVSMLYVRVPDRQSIPSCADSTVDAPLLALADPANPDLPPPPGAALGSGAEPADTRAATGGAARPRVAAAPGAAAPAAPAGPGLAVAPPAIAPADPVPALQPTVGSGAGSATLTPPAAPEVIKTPQNNVEPDDPDATPRG